ncbi:MAG TPA: polysaccharide deacetylase family protein [Candidatus Omnitrophota bacterium]|nr:polysaccharide deacetylase family protein [Candidatus Omnitrophota bacterium]
MNVFIITLVVFYLKILLAGCVIAIGAIAFCLFFDQAVLVRAGTVFRVKTKSKKIALTFDDGPSEVWTPKILDELKKCDLKATFFMIGAHVKKFPQIARRVAQENHTIGNHGYAHSVLLYYTDEELEAEIKYTELVIKETTGATTKYFRPPKAWIRAGEKIKIRSMGYEVVLWSVNSKDWVPFHHQQMVCSIARQVKSGDILLFHDSGGILKAEGGDRNQTVLAIPALAKALREKGFEFVTIEELLNEK